jgi:hypothetical protein
MSGSMGHSGRLDKINPVVTPYFYCFRYNLSLFFNRGMILRE